MLNTVVLIGRLTKDVDFGYIPNSQTAKATFPLAIDRPAKGEEKKTDFPRIIVFGRQAENCNKYLAKGRLVAIQGRIQTGSYQNKNGDTIYTTDVIANSVQFLEWGEKRSEHLRDEDVMDDAQDNVQATFEAIDEDAPF